jgi:hypothetical protein
MRALTCAALLASLSLLTGCWNSVPLLPPPDTKAARAHDVWVAALDAQRNIRSGRHVDLVVNESGHAFLATFARPKGTSPMELRVVALDRDGSRRWQLGEGLPGRAMSIARSSGGRLWVTGFVDEAFPWKRRAAAGASGPLPFLLALDEEGEVELTRYGTPGLVPELVRVASDGSVLLVGQSKGGASWDEVSIAGGHASQRILVAFDSDGRCRWMRALVGGVYVSQLRSDRERGFVLGGSFLQTLSYGNESRTSVDSFDSEAFLMRVDPHGELIWLKTLGRPGNPRYGYRSREGVLDLRVSASGEVIMAGILDGEGGEDLVTVQRFDSAGQPLSRFELDVRAQPPGSTTLALDQAEHAWLAFTRGSPNGEGSAERVLELLRIGPNGKLASRHAEPTAINTMPRALAHDGRGLWMVGHFQGWLAWKGKRVENEGHHQLFAHRAGLPLPVNPH